VAYKDALHSHLPNSINMRNSLPADVHGRVP